MHLRRWASSFDDSGAEALRHCAGTIELIAQEPEMSRCDLPVHRWREEINNSDPRAAAATSSTSVTSR